VPRPRLLSAGEAFEDLVFSGLDRLPAPGEEVRTRQFAATLGGGAVITAVAAARLDVAVTLASGLADATAARLRRERMRVHNLRRAGEPTAVSVALSTAADRAFVTFDGVNEILEPRLAGAVPGIAATHVHLAFYPRDCDRWARVVARLRRSGRTVSADFGWNDKLAADPALPRLIDELDLVFFNELEATLYAGKPTPDEALAHWRTAAATVIVKRGAAGSAWLDPTTDVEARPPRVRAMDTTGAGDAFNGGFLWAWMRGEPRERCLAAGNFVGARSTRRAGGFDALPHLADLPAAWHRSRRVKHPGHPGHPE
jgi:sugar/nucleoside kinase (ribokinase family)